MAGLIAGNGAASANRSGGAFPGVAPASHVVAVKVAGRNGVVDVSTVLEAMHWVSAYREQFGIRVLNLSWGVASTQSPSVDPVNHAVQRLWSEGIVVVVAAGNSGGNAGTITKPGDDPVVLTVGAYDDKGDLEPNNDGVPTWSSRGPTAAGLAKPDLVAPGRTVVALRSPGSTIEQNNGKALVGSSYIRGSGTSQAAAVTSGAAALLLAARPGLTPDQVKALLTSTASPIPSSSRYAQGAGRLQVEAASAAPTPTSVQPLPGNGLGSIDASRGSGRVVATCNGAAVEIRGEVDVRCQAWNGSRWTGSRWSGDAWTGVAWKGAEWTGVAWKGVAWSDATWDGVAWKGGTWTSGTWYGASGWTGDPTVASPWTGVAWKDSNWSGVAWKESGWTTGEWTGAEYDEFLTAFWGSTPPPGKLVKGEPFTRAGNGNGNGNGDGNRQRQRRRRRQRRRQRQRRRRRRRQQAVSDSLPRERALVSLVSVMGVLGVGVLAWGAWQTATSAPSLGRWFVLVVVLTLLTDVTAIDLRVGRHTESHTWSELTVVLGLALLPASHLVLTTVALGVAYLVTGQALVKWVLNVGSYAVGLALAAVACSAVGTVDWRHPQRSVVALLVGAGVWAVWNKLTTDTAISLAQDRPLPTVLRSALPSTAVRPAVQRRAGLRLPRAREGAHRPALGRAGVHRPRGDAQPVLPAARPGPRGVAVPRDGEPRADRARRGRARGGGADPGHLAHAGRRRRAAARELDLRGRPPRAGPHGRPGLAARHPDRHRRPRARPRRPAGRADRGVRPARRRR